MTNSTSLTQSSWPWMKDVDVAIADPIPPVCAEDDRPAVKELIDEHAAKIAKIRTALQEHPLYEPSKHDDLWILRFWLSHKKSKAAIEAAKYTLEFRHEHNLDAKDIRDQVYVTTGINGEYTRTFKKQDAFIACHPDPQRGVISFIKVASFDFHRAVKELPEEYWLPVFLQNSEWSFQWLDYVTRTTGRLTKSIRFIDCEGISLGCFNREALRRDGKAMGVLEDCYPQSLDMLYVVNAPAFVQMIWSIVKVIMPKRVVSKFDMISPQDNPAERKQIYRFLSEDDLPAKFGGKNKRDPQYW